MRGMTMTDELLTVRQMAARLQVGRTRAYEILRRDLPSVRLARNGRLRVRASDLQRYIESLEPAYQAGPR